MQATIGERVTVESAAALTLNRFCHQVASGMYELTDAEETIDGVVVAIGGETAAPYTATIQKTGLAWVASDGAGAIDEDNVVNAGATGYCKVQAIADGAVIHYLGGRARTPAAATAGLLVLVELMPQVASLT